MPASVQQQSSNAATAAPAKPTPTSRSSGEKTPLMSALAGAGDEAGVFVAVADVVAVADAVPEAVADSDALAVPVAVPDAVAEAVAEAVADADGRGVGAKAQLAPRSMPQPAACRRSMR